MIHQHVATFHSPTRPFIHGGEHPTSTSRFKQLTIHPPLPQEPPFLNPVFPAMSMWNTYTAQDSLRLDYEDVMSAGWMPSADAKANHFLTPDDLKSLPEVGSYGGGIGCGRPKAYYRTLTVEAAALQKYGADGLSKKRAVRCVASPLRPRRPGEAEVSRWRGGGRRGCIQDLLSTQSRVRRATARYLPTSASVSPAA
jgi:hypothetical protein